MCAAQWIFGGRHFFKSMKRVIILNWKDGRAPISIYKNAVELVKRNPTVGVCIGALWNALSKGNGRYENKVCIIERKEVMQ